MAEKLLSLLSECQEGRLLCRSPARRRTCGWLYHGGIAAPSGVRCDSGFRPELSERQFRAVLAAAEQVDSFQDIISSPKEVEV